MSYTLKPMFARNALSSTYGKKILRSILTKAVFFRVRILFGDQDEFFSPGGTKEKWGQKPAGANGLITKRISSNCCIKKRDKVKKIENLFRQRD